MNFKAEEIARFVKGEIIGDPSVAVSSVAKIEEGKSGSLAFLSNPKYEPYLYDSGASVILVNKDFVPRREFKATLIIVDDSYQAFASLMELYAQSRAIVKSGIEQPSFIHETAVLGEGSYFGAFAYADSNVTIGKRVKIFPHVYIGSNTVIGDDTTIYSGVKIYDDTRIGARCIIHSGAVIGADGFGFAPQNDGRYRKIPQIGFVILEDDVEIGANTTVDCGTMDPTIIRKGVKLDNLVMIGHNCEIGENTVMAGQTGLAGSTQVGKNCRFGGQVGIAGHLSVGDNVQIAAQSGASKDIKSDQIVLGTPVMEHRQALRMYMVLRNLPQLRQEVNELLKEMKKVKENALNKPV